MMTDACAHLCSPVQNCLALFEANTDAPSESSDYFAGMGLGLGVAEGDGGDGMAGGSGGGDDDEADTDPFAGLDIGEIECANFHDNLEAGGVLDGKSAIWRAPEDYGSLRCATAMLERAVLEREVRGSLQATHPAKEHLERALALGVDNAEVAQSAKMLELEAQRQAAEGRTADTAADLRKSAAANDVLVAELDVARREAASRHDTHTEEYDALLVFYFVFTNRISGRQRHC